MSKLNTLLTIILLMEIAIFGIAIMFKENIILGEKVHIHKSIGVELENYTDYLKCDNKNLEKTVECLNLEVKEIYKYTSTKETHKNISDIRENGGDCYDYSNLYIEMATNLGFEGDTIRIPLDKKEWHIIAIIYSKEGYCTLDQIAEPNCITYKKERGI